jgi:hypothetical protein
VRLLRIRIAGTAGEEGTPPHGRDLRVEVVAPSGEVLGQLTGVRHLSLEVEGYRQPVLAHVIMHVDAKGGVDVVAADAGDATEGKKL